MTETYCYLKPEARVTQSPVSGHWVVDRDDSIKAQGYRAYDDALAEAMSRTAVELRRRADHYERSAKRLAGDPDLLNA